MRVFIECTPTQSLWPNASCLSHFFIPCRGCACCACCACVSCLLCLLCFAVLRFACFAVLCFVFLLTCCASYASVKHPYASRCVSMHPYAFVTYLHGVVGWKGAQASRPAAAAVGPGAENRRAWGGGVQEGVAGRVFNRDRGKEGGEEGGGERFKAEERKMTQTYVVSRSKQTAERNHVNTHQSQKACHMQQPSLSLAHKKLTTQRWQAERGIHGPHPRFIASLQDVHSLSHDKTFAIQYLMTSHSQPCSSRNNLSAALNASG